ncbi:COG4 transport protein-domain-containing protein [Rhodotorula diobovata]|uniref:Conserved oligomeric Golgi complex subunit 4 n=1 Tax=Rhodotorula diobovata TaxID=5288 RepID=A0A5C5FLP8_9BASI|nr:COG4 transport protein-domain-containing protein [Rhodotorula diobovata]
MAAVSPAPPPLRAPDLASSSESPARVDPAALLTRADGTLDARLTGLISSRARLAAQLRTLGSLGEVVGGIQGEAEHMAGEIGAVAETAERVGAKVRGLDQEQSRVKECIEMVQAVQDLKSTIASVDINMQKHDWEAATRCMQRATAIDPAIVSSTFADAVVPTADLPSAPTATLAQLRASLLDTFLTSFRAAAESNDTNNINRFFKLFPMIEEEDKGLEVYAQWVADIVRAKTGALSSKSQSPTHFSVLLTSLFEAIALIISQHQPVVEKYYGEGKMLSVAGSLMSETDKLGLRVVANWEDERRIRRRVADAHAHRFASADAEAYARKPLPPKPGSSPMGQQGAFDAPQASEGDLDPREADAILTELTMMSGRWQLLRRFLYGSLKVPIAAPPSNSDGATATLDPPVPSKAPEVPAPAADEADLAVVEDSELGKALTKQLRDAYMPLEVWYLRTAIERAHQMDEPDFSSTPYLSSSLDDTFYIVKKTLHRVVSTASVSNLVGMCKEMRIVLERDVAEVWKARIEGAFKDLAANAQSQSAIGGMAVTGMAGMAQLGGRAREEERETRERDARNVYIVYLNNLDTAASYTSRLLAELSASDALGSAFFLFTELDRARTSFALLRSSEDKFRAVLKSGLDHLFNQLVRPKLRPLLSDVYKDVSYKLDDDAYNEAEYRDDVRKRFVKAWDALLSGYKDSLTEGNFNLFFSTAVNVLVRPWESMIRGMKFTELGALRLDRDIRTILSYLSSQASFASGSLRESFSRLQQIATLLTLDSPEEAEEVLTASGNRLTMGEVRSIWALRVRWRSGRVRRAPWRLLSARAALLSSSPPHRAMSSPSGKRAAAPPSSDDTRPAKIPRVEEDPSSSPTLRRSDRQVTWLPSVGVLKSLLHATYGQPKPSIKVAAFSLEYTLIMPKDLVPYFSGATEWKWFTGDGRVKAKLRELHAQGRVLARSYAIVIFATQTSPSKERLDEYKTRIGYVLRDLDVPVRIFTSTSYDPYRKPAPAAWTVFERDWNGDKEIDMKASFYIGSAAGASTSTWDWDLKFSVNIGLLFSTPQQYFLGELNEDSWHYKGWIARKHDHSLPLFMPTAKALVPRPLDEWHDQIYEVILFVGPPSCGKTHLWQTRYESKGYARTSPDAAGIQKLLAAEPPVSIIVDASLPSQSTRRSLFHLVESSSSRHRVRAFVWDVDETVAKHNFVFNWLYSSKGDGEGDKRAWLSEEDWRRWFGSYDKLDRDEGLYLLVKHFVFKFDTAEFGQARFKAWRNKFLSCYPADPIKLPWK